MQANGLKTFEQQRICQLRINASPHLAILRAIHRDEHCLYFFLYMLSEFACIYENILTKRI